MSDVQKRIERARELDKAATPRPWYRSGWIIQDAGGYVVAEVRDGNRVVNNARLIEGYRDLAPALADDCEALKIELTAARSDLAAMDQERQGLREELARVRAEVRMHEDAKVGVDQELRDLRAKARRRCEERDALRDQLARYEQAGLPEEVAEIERRDADFATRRGPIVLPVYDDRATLLAAVRKLQAERDTKPNVELELPEGDGRKIRIVWSEFKDRKLHLCVTIDGEPAEMAALREGLKILQPRHIRGWEEVERLAEALEVGPAALAGWER